ncbi:zinc-dependent alcohol dehydrogenase [Runella zeae]|uniref:zinc-dependent alcohol dehydrogenase n=1 Tax=Runella zeae TaxID=94255 RepID=UPI0023546612|nr:alcohol dehydrogenase catalytic domain-containing protein [Runella zeae]
MEALFYEGNHSFTLKTIERQPLKAGEVRLKVAYVGVCGTDVHIYHGKMDTRVKIPQVIGHEVSGIIDEIAEGVNGWEVGENVTVRPLNPGQEVPADNGYQHIGQHLKFIGIDSPGGMQQYWNVPAFTLHRLPQNLPLSLGAMIEPLAVACHDIRLGEVKAGENAVIIGGGPIGLLIALVARHKGAKVLISEVNQSRIEFIQSLGFQTVNPIEEDLVKRVENFSEGAMADVVFEVSGVQAGVTAMTQLPKVRGRIVMVAIHSEPKAVDLFRFFWREIKLIGARVYEPEDFEEAIALAASGVLPLAKMITQISPLSDAQQVFETIDQNPAGMKYLLELIID